MLPLVQTAGQLAKRIMSMQRANPILPDDVLNVLLKTLINGRLQKSDAEQTLRPTIDKTAWEAITAEEQDAFIEALVKDKNIKKQLTVLLKLSYKSVKDDIVTNAVFEFFPEIENSNYLKECRALLTKCYYSELTAKARVHPPSPLSAYLVRPPLSHRRLCPLPPVVCAAEECQHDSSCQQSQGQGGREHRSTNASKLRVRVAELLPARSRLLLPRRPIPWDGVVLYECLGLLTSAYDLRKWVCIASNLF